MMRILFYQDHADFIQLLLDAKYDGTLVTEEDGYRNTLTDKSKYSKYWNIYQRLISFKWSLILMSKDLQKLPWTLM